MKTNKQQLLDMFNDKLFEDFKQSEMPIFRILGKFQMVLAVIFICCIPSFFWIDSNLLFKIMGSCCICFCLIGLIYHYLDKFMRKAFDDYMGDAK